MDNGDAVFGGIAFVVVVAIIVGFISLFGATWASPDGAQNIVVRNGGLFDNKQVREIVPAGTGTKFVGMWSSEHPYPESPFYWTTDGSDSGDSQTVLVTTKDSQQVGIEGRFSGALNDTPAALTNFDNVYGNRTFNGKYAWDGQDGFNAFLNSFMPQVVTQSAQVGRAFACTDLNTQCAQAKGLTGAPQVDVVPNIALLQDQIRAAFAAEVNRTLGGDFVKDVNFTLTKVTLNDNLQKSVNDSASAIAQANAATVQAQAKVASAQADATANAERQRGYNACSACAAIDQTKAEAEVARAVQPGAVFIPGGQGVNLNLPVGAR